MLQQKFTSMNLEVKNIFTKTLFLNAFKMMLHPSEELLM
jgi:hypothetical protein